MGPRIELRHHGQLTLGLALPLGLVALVGCSQSAAPESSPDPAMIRIHVEPASAIYALNQEVELIAEVTDALGQPIPDLVPTVVGTPSTMVETLDAAELRLLDEGQITLEGCVESSNGPLCDDIRIWVDAGEPLLVVASPQPGQELGAPDDTIVVIGDVEDAQSITVFVNGVPANVTNGRFMAEVTPEFGVNHLTVVASDAFGRQATRELDVMWATEYITATDDGVPKISLPQSIGLHLGQNFFDDGVPLDTSTLPYVSNDLAGILEAVVGSLDLISIVPNPLIETPARVELTEVTLDEVELELALTNTGVEVFIRIGDLFIGTDGEFQFEELTFDLDGGIRASVIAYATATISKPTEDASLEVTVDDFTAAIEEANGEFDDDEVNAIFALAEGTLRATLESQIESTIADTLDSALPSVLSEALGALDSVLMNQMLTLPAPLPMLTLTIGGNLGELQTTYRDQLLTSLGVTMGIDSDAIFPDSRGVPLMVPFDTPPPSFNDARLAVGVRAALVNSLLHLLWNGGILDLDITALGGEEIAGLVKNGRIQGLLAPVVRPPRVLEPYDLVFSLGQLQLSGEILGSEMTYGITIEAGASANIQNNTISFEIQEVPNVTAWIIASESANPLVNDDALEQLLIYQVWPALRTALMDGLGIISLPLPAADLSSIAVSELSEATVYFSLLDSPEFVDGVFLLQGDLTAVLDAP